MLIGSRLSKVELFKSPTDAHFPASISTKWGQRCRVCESKTKVKCERCSEVYGKQIIMCAIPCFKTFHLNIDKYLIMKK